MTDEKKLQAWHNGYECVAARSEEEAREVLRAADLSYEAEDLDGDGWKVVPVDKVVRNDDGEPDETIGQMLAESSVPRHLYSCEV